MTLDGGAGGGLATETDLEKLAAGHPLLTK